METQVDVAPVLAVLNSLTLLNRSGAARGLSSWVQRTVKELTVETAHRNQVVGHGLMLALVPDADWASFTEYLDDLAASSPATLRDRLLRRVVELARLRSGATYTPAALLADWRTYVDALKAAQPSEPVQVMIAHETHNLLNNPALLHDLALSHLREMWADWLAGEWERMAPALRQAAGRMRGQVLSGRPVLEALHTLVGRDTWAWETLSADISRTVLVPAPHNGVVTTFLRGDSTLWVCIGRDLFSAELVRSTPVGRLELLHRLQALADDSRLHILELLHQHEELSAQDLIAHTGITQSSASRDLNNLRNAGFVRERRVGGANKFYRLAPNHVAGTFEALEQLLSGQGQLEATPAPSREPAHPLGRFLNAAGNMVTWPPKQKDRLLLLQYLVETFEVGRLYSEKEVNAILKPHTGSDVAALRRALCEFRLLDREGDGSRYWRTP
ncbi:MAG: metalloregulator ArsR/SmtB family transcription factor [Herpetosiphonaceae bacterium]|nr:metalloregulator ArsR/SmtB family transcription factor [Herpetosiphonaceae bacterium]